MRPGTAARRDASPGGPHLADGAPRAVAPRGARGPRPPRRTRAAAVSRRTVSRRAGAVPGRLLKYSPGGVRDRANAAGTVACRRGAQAAWRAAFGDRGRGKPYRAYGAQAHRAGCGAAADRVPQPQASFSSSLADHRETSCSARGAARARRPTQARAVSCRRAQGGLSRMDSGLAQAAEQGRKASSVQRPRPCRDAAPCPAAADRRARYAGCECTSCRPSRGPQGMGRR